MVDCAGFRDSQVKPSYESRLAAASVRSGASDARCCLSERIEEVVKHQPRSAIHIEEQLGWAHKLGGPISWVGQSLQGSPRQVKQC